MYELGLDFRAAGMPRRATRAMEEVVLEEPGHEGALRVLAALYEEQARFNEAAGLWQRLGKQRGEDTSHREHHLLVAAAQAALGRDDLDSAKQLLKSAEKLEESAHFFAAAAELAAARGNHGGAKERLKQALIAEPALAPHLLPGLIAAAQGLVGSATDEPTGRADDEPKRQAPELAVEATPLLPAAVPAPSSGTLAVVAPATAPVKPPQPSRIAFVQLPASDARSGPSPAVVSGVLAVLAEVEAQTGPRLELALIRAQLVPPADEAARSQLASQLAARFPESLAARVAAARLAMAGEDPAAIRAALDELVSDTGALAWTLRGRWQCAHCGNRPGTFSWRCGQCRRWNTLRMETGIEPPPVAPRERREKPRPVRTVRPDGLLGAAPDDALPPPMLDPGLSDVELAHAGVRRSLLGRVGGWVSGVWRRDAS
jgi:lipopolysaccharide biosynthesis regulator YciM